MRLIINRWLTVALLCLGASLALPWSAPQVVRADSAEEVNAHVDTALRRFRKLVKTADQLREQAPGVLVVPNVREAGLIVGGRWGEGALFVNGADRPTAYYRLTGGSIGLQAGYKKVDLVFLFLTDEALNKFRSEDTWTAGAEAGLTVVDANFDGSIETLRRRGSVAVFAFDTKGLMAGLTISGTKFTRFVPDDSD